MIIGASQRLNQIGKSPEITKSDLILNSTPENRL